MAKLQIKRAPEWWQCRIAAAPPRAFPKSLRAPGEEARSRAVLLKLRRSQSGFATILATIALVLISPAASLAQASSGIDAPLSVALDTDLTLYPDLTAQIVETRRISVFTAAAIQSQGQQVINYIEGMQSLEIVEAYTHKGNGTRVVVEPSAILTSDAASGVAAVYTRDLRAQECLFLHAAKRKIRIFFVSCRSAMNFVKEPFFEEPKRKSGSV